MDTDLSARIEKLETTIRRLKTLVVVVLIGAGAIVGSAVVSAQSGADKVDSAYHENVEAHNFVLIGRDDKAYGRLYVKGDQPVLELYDRSGKTIWCAPPCGIFTPAK
jgi:hypothetical protein